MHLVALFRRPTDLDGAVKALAQEAGMTLAEARMRLAPEPPALLARLDEARATPLVDSLRRAGLAVLAVEESGLQTGERLVVRSFALGAGRLEVKARSGEGWELAWDEVSAVLRAVTATTSRTEHTEKARGFALGTAVLTGGLKMTKTVEKTVRASATETEQLVYLYARDGRCAVFRELACDFSCLGPAMQPVRAANMATIARLLRERTPAAFHDDRLVRLGTRALPFVIGAESQLTTAAVSHHRTTTAGGTDVLAEVLHQAVAQGLLP